MTQAEELAKQGWVNKGTYDQPRLSEIIAMYEDIGLAVHLEPYDPSADPGCTDCMGANAQNYKTIYTRKRRF
jgi:hypothetical protein